MRRAVASSPQAPRRSRRSGGVSVLALAAASLAVLGGGRYVFACFRSRRDVVGVADAALAARSSTNFVGRTASAAPGEILSRVGRAALPPELEAGLDLRGKVALVTGASRGIGAAIARKLALAGATVVGTATSQAGAESISRQFTDGLEGEGMVLDVTQQEQVAALLRTMEGKYGLPDILVNNAGITKDSLMMRMKDDQWDDVINTNLNSVSRLTKACLKGMMKKKWGRVVSISSVVGSMGNAGQANYAAAKAGLDGFSRALAREVASRGITVNTVAPGFIATDMTGVLKDEYKAKLLESVPAGRLGTPAEVANAVLFLASPSADYVTGLTMHVNGGMYMR